MFKANPFPEQPILTAVSADQLLHEYTAGESFFWASAQHTLLAKGERLRLTHNDSYSFTTLPTQVATLLHQAKSSANNEYTPIMVGAIPFDLADSPVELLIPETWQWAGTLSQEQPLDPSQKGGSEPDITTSYQLRPIPEPDQYERGVRTVLNHLEHGHLQKVVLSRSLEVMTTNHVEVAPLVQHLARHNTRGYTFAVPMQNRSTSESTSPRTFIGASPELLVMKKGNTLTANPLAGSAARSDDPVEDQRRANALLSSAKDRHEHEVVIKAVVQALQPFCQTLHVPLEPSLIQTATMWHLSTEIHGVLLDPATTSLELATALHPTPAICGTPTDLAREAIREIEPFERGLFTGMVGWCDANGDGEWAVTIRCAEVQGQRIQLFAGAGIVAGSRPEDELAETGAKFRTMLHALGLRNHPSSMRKEEQ